MTVAALYDVHGNLPALEAVLADPRFATADTVVVGGDVVAGPDPAGVLALLAGLGDRVRFLRGNADRETVLPESTEGPLWAITSWARERLTSSQLEHLGAWPATVELDIGGLGRVVFCHATPRSDDELITRLTPDDAVAEVLAGVEADVVVCGHVHVQYDRRPAGAPRVVNAGSVGMPYEGRPGAFWALLGPTVEHCCTEYELDDAIRRLGETGYPELEDLADNSLRGGVSPDDVSAFFESKRGA